MTRIPAVIIASILLFSASADAQQQIAPVAKNVTVFGYKLQYPEAGRGEPVILLHGTGGEGARWMPQIQGLSSDFRVIRSNRSASGNPTNR